MDKIRIGVIGTGHLGRFHAKILSTIESANLVGVYDVDYEKAKSVGNEFGAPVFKNIEDLLRQCEAVVIASTTSSHKIITLKAFEYNCHVLVEKPIAENVLDGTIMVESADSAHKILMVGHVEHFNPAFTAARNIIDKPLFIESHRLTIYRGRGADVSVVHDLLIHDIELLLAILKQDIIALSASGSSILTNSPDIANVRIKFSGGCVANLTASRISLTNMRKMRFFQHGAYIGVDFGGTVEVAKMNKTNIITPEDAEIIDLPGGEKIAKWNEPVKQGNALQIELEHFIKCIMNNKEPLVSGKNGLDALRVVERIVKEIGIS